MGVLLVGYSLLYGYPFNLRMLLCFEKSKYCNSDPKENKSEAASQPLQYHSFTFPRLYAFARSFDVALRI